MPQSCQVTVALVGGVAKYAADRSEPVDESGIRELSVGSNRGHESHFIGRPRNASCIVRMVATGLLQGMIDEEKIGQSIGSDIQDIDWYSAFVAEFLVVQQR